MDLKAIGDEFLGLIKEHADQIGVELDGDFEAASEFAAQRAAHLSTIVGEPGFSEAMVAERDAIALRLTGDAIERADAIDGRVLAFIGQSLMLSARLLAAVV